MQLVGDALGQLTGQLGALLERNTRDRDERTYVRGTHTGMRSLMITHIDNLGSFLDALESRFQHGFGFSDEGTTVRLVASPGSTSSNLTPSTASIAEVIC